jgi:hypothetical protein
MFGRGVVSDNKTESTSETLLETRAQQVLHASVTHLDARTLSRLTRARHTALEQLPRRRVQLLRRTFIPVGSAIAAGLVAVVLWIGPMHSHNRPSPEFAPEDMEIITDEEDLDLMGELDFYSWVGSQSELADQGRDSG